jgi:hypothetical protein
MLLAKELLSADSVAFSSLNAYGQILYWVALWAVVCLECRTSDEAEVILRGLVGAALIAASSLLLGHFVGGDNPYADYGVTSDAGWFGTAKTVTGVLLTGAVLLLYFGATRRSIRYKVLAVVCCVCCMMTYARAGQVALGILILWLAVWCLVKPAGTDATPVIHFLVAMVLIGAMCGSAVLHSQSFVNRWQDVQDPEKGGSGRAAIWRIAVENYVDSAEAEKVFGVGYTKMTRMILRDYGLEIHTHNDLLDMMLVGGLCGIAWWTGLVITFIGYAARGLRTREGFASVGIFLIFACHGQLTGQIWDNDVMVMYVVSLACLSTIEATRSVQNMRLQNKVMHEAV